MTEILILHPDKPDMAADRRSEGLTREGFSVAQEKVITENKLGKLTDPDSWQLGQTGMIFPYIVPAYQEEDTFGNKIGKGKVRVIKLATPDNSILSGLLSLVRKVKHYMLR